MMLTKPNYYLDRITPAVTRAPTLHHAADLRPAEPAEPAEPAA